MPFVKKVMLFVKKVLLNPYNPAFRFNPFKIQSIFLL